MELFYIGSQRARRELVFTWPRDFIEYGASTLKAWWEICYIQRGKV